MIEIKDGIIIKDGKKIGTANQDLQYGYHPSVLFMYWQRLINSITCFLRTKTNQNSKIKLWILWAEYFYL